MTSWPNLPVVYEVNAWVWLHELSHKRGERITLKNVPKVNWPQHSSKVLFLFFSIIRAIL